MSWGWGGDLYGTYTQPLGNHAKWQETMASDRKKYIRGEIWQVVGTYGMCQEYIIRETMVRSRNSKKSSKILPMAEKYCKFQEKIIHTVNLVQVIGSYDRWSETLEIHRNI